jgi:hypothetical protein
LSETVGAQWDCVLAAYTKALQQWGEARICAAFPDAFVTRLPRLSVGQCSHHSGRALFPHREKKTNDFNFV